MHLAVLSLMLLMGCHKREERTACWDARQKARDAITRDRLDEATQQLEAARTTCAGQSSDDLRRIEGIIADRREAKRAIELEQADQEKAMEFPTKRFVSWATEPRDKFSETLVHTECAPRGSPDFGFCESERKDHPEMRVRFWEHDRDAVRYSFTTRLPLECEDLGEHRRVRQWKSNHKSYELCELTQREARDLSALLVRDADQNKMYIYSFDYLKKDPEFERLVRERGTRD